jgi:hypothetical protein
MKIEKFTILILVGLLFLSMASLATNAQNTIPVNEPYNQAQPANIVPPASFAQQPYSYAEPNANAPAMPATNMPYGAPMMSGLQGAAPCGVPCAAGVPCAGTPCVGAPLVAPIVAPVAGPYTNSFAYSNQQSSAFGPFTPPVTQASEQFYQYPGLTPYGVYPGAGYAATGGIGFDPMSGYYGPYGAYTPL